MNTLSKIITTISAAALAFTMVGCAAQTTAEEVTVVTETIEAPVEFGAVEQAVVDMFRQAVPNDPATDEQIIEESILIGEELKDHLDNGGSAETFLQGLTAEDPDNILRNSALLTGALTLDPSLASHPNY